MSQSDIPAVPAGHTTTQLEPEAHVVWHGGWAHSNSHALPAPQVHCPSQHCPVQDGLSPAHVTWQGPDSHTKSQAAPCSHVHVPSAHEAEHVEPERQSIEHGGESQLNVQVVPPGQPHEAFEQSPSAEPWHATAAPIPAQSTKLESFMAGAALAG
jgi:hypothetical protein